VGGSGSFSQLSLFGACRRAYKAVYLERREQRSEFLSFGKLVHEAIKMVNLRIMEARGHVSPEDLEAAKRHLATWGQYSWYARACAWLDRYAARMSERVSSGEVKIAAVEQTFQVVFPSPDGDITMVGVLDLLLLNERDEPTFVEFKTWGVIPSREELEDDIQLGVYNAVYREARRYLGVAWKEWHSVLHDATVQASADVSDADSIKRFVRRVVEQVRTEQEWPERVNRRCGSCPRADECEALRRVVRPVGIDRPTAATLRSYYDLGQRYNLLGDLREQVKVLVTQRMVEAGGVLEEEGLTGKMLDVPGGREVRYVTQPRTMLTVRPSR
jgi:hypothetical protein